jgi:hypothetical protein
LITPADRIITSQVIMALLGATTVQAGANAAIIARYLVLWPPDMTRIVVRIRVDAPGAEVINLYVATPETAWDIHDIICDALKGRPQLASVGPQDPATMLDFVLDPFRDWTPPDTK